MKPMKTFLILFFLMITAFSSITSQEYSWFYLQAKDTLTNLEFKRENEELVYKGNDKKLIHIFNKHKIYEFKKTYRNANNQNLKRTFFVISNNEDLLNDLLENAKNIFASGNVIAEEDKKIFEPNDYGLTSTIGDNIGLQINLDYMDVLGVPQAWYYTTGSKETIIGLSDGQVEIPNKDFSGKTTMIKKSTVSKGHGSGVAAIAAGQGDNGYGLTGVCYDCSIYTTSYGDFKYLKQLVELSEMGVKVINCSWASTSNYPNAQKVIDELFDKGTIIVSAAGNKDWKKGKGEVFYYPSSYNNVISVSSVMHRYKNINENILISKKGNPYAANIRNYVGRTIGFKDKDITKKHHIWPVSITTLNIEVDLLAPSVDLFRFSQYALYEKEMYTAEATSSTAPFVTGTIGLMLTLNPCFPVDEVESILKLTATNIDGIYANKPYKGYYGAGMVHIGRAVKMVYDLYTEGETATIENQNFSRWDFKLTSYSEKVVIQNQKFTLSSTLDLTAKNSIVIRKNTILKPNESGSIHLKIDPTLAKECDLVLRKGFPNNKYYFPKQ